VFFFFFSFLEEADIWRASILLEDEVCNYLGQERLSKESAFHDSSRRASCGRPCFREFQILSLGAVAWTYRRAGV
jgi:hypothetical protein